MISSDFVILAIAAIDPQLRGPDKQPGPDKFSIVEPMLLTLFHIRPGFKCDLPTPFAGCQLSHVSALRPTDGTISVR